MTIQELFEKGHTVGLIRKPLRRAVQVKEPPDKAGFWMIPAATAAAFLARKKVDPADLSERVDAATQKGEWDVDYAFCWCKKCSDSRRLSQTSDGGF